MPSLRRAHPEARGAAAARRAARCGAARPDRARGAGRFAQQFPDGCRPIGWPSSMAFAEDALEDSTGSRASPPSGRRASTASPPGLPRPSASGAASVTRIVAEVDGAIVLAGAAGAVHAEGARRPHRHRQRRRLVITDYKTGDARRPDEPRASRASRRSCRWRPPSPRPAASPASRHARSRAALHLARPAASRRVEERSLERDDLAGARGRHARA